MSLIKETGSGVTGANTYATADDVAIYCSNRGLTEWADSTNATAKDQAILRAMDYYESLSWKGIKANDENDLEWPRSGVLDKNGYSIDSDVIPIQVQYGLCRASYEEFKSPGCLLKNMTKEDFVTEKEIEGAISKKYQPGKDKTVYSAIIAHISQFVDTFNGTVTVVRT
jgi:hypothetical protein